MADPITEGMLEERLEEFLDIVGDLAAWVHADADEAVRQAAFSDQHAAGFRDLHARLLRLSESLKRG